ncbi:MAG: VCBS repeat-containing protein, partial [Rhodospirillales bacterium]|nr:VCBS repeat-containing protein [Rhodospirillales bacterium]
MSQIPVESAPSPHVLQAIDGGMLTIPGDAWLLKADFSPQGPDLLLSGPDGTQVLIRDFFNLENPPDLLTDTGAMITADLAINLAGPLAPGQSASALDDQLAQAAESIGRVEATDGLVEAIRVDGTKVTLSKGDDIFQGDTLITAKGAAIGITFIDDTTFSLGEEGRMVIDEMVYDGDTQEGQFSANLIQGVFSFVSGEIAKTSPEGMTVTTPVATIGIRGTKVAGRAAQEGAENTISLLPETDAQGVQIVGELSVTNQGGTVTLNSVGATVQMSSAFQPPPPPVTFSQQQLQQNYGAALTTLSTTAAAKATADAAEGAAEAEQAEADAQAAEAEAEAAAAEAEAAQAEADAAQAEAEASGDPEAIAAAEAAQAEAEAKAAEAEAKAAEAETAIQEAEAKAQEAQVAQAEAEHATNEMQAQAQAFQAFGGPPPGESPVPVEGAPESDGDSPVDAVSQADNGGDTFNGDSPFGGGDTFDGGGDVLFGSGDSLFGDGLSLLGGGGGDLFGGSLLAPPAGGDTLLFGYEPLPPDFFATEIFDAPPPDDPILLLDEPSDIVIGNAAPTVSLSVDSTQTPAFTNSGATTFDSLVTNSFGEGASEIIDVDNDGDMDIVIHGYDSVVGTNPASTSVGLNDGSGTFTYSTVLANSLFTHGMDMADVNADGNVDIVFAQNSATAQPVYLGDGIGGFSVLTQNNTINTTGGTIGGNNVDLADFNGDGLTDMFVNVDAGAKVYLNAQNGDAAGQFTDTGQSLT